MIEKDHLQREIHLPKTPQRIISLVPSLTELLHDLGLEKRIVGITKYCVHPFHYGSTKIKVGGTKKVKFDVIKELNPDFILCSKEENTAEMVSELEKIAPVFVSDVNSFQEAMELIIQFGEIFGKRIESQNLVAKINSKYADFQSFIKNKRTIKVAYFIWKEPWMVVGSPTFINDILRINRMENVFEKKGRYPEININHLKLQGNPELLLFSSEPYHFIEDDAYEVLHVNEKVLTIFVDGQYFSWYGSRLLKAFDYFKKIQAKIEIYEGI
jgi:ABC-type Fe3+-hydroxamate transport system substrate-binding protein